jgi:hypothetical protein
MRLDPQTVRAGYIAGRQSILAEAEALRGEMREHVAGLQRELAATRNNLRRHASKLECCANGTTHIALTSKLGAKCSHSIVSVSWRRPGRSNSIR